jgi:hypothetical protein
LQHFFAAQQSLKATSVDCQVEAFLQLRQQIASPPIEPFVSTLLDVHHRSPWSACALAWAHAASDLDLIAEAANAQHLLSLSNGKRLPARQLGRDARRPRLQSASAPALSTISALRRRRTRKPYGHRSRRSAAC